MKVKDKIKKPLLEDLKEIRKEINFKELVNKISDAYFTFDKDLKYIYWNQAASKLFGIKAKEVLGKSILDIFPNNEQTQKTINAFKNVLKTKRSQTFSNEHQIKGKDFIFESSVHPSRSGLIVFARDITKRKKLDDKILKLEKELGAMYKNVPVILLLVDEERRVRKANKAALQFANRLEGEINGLRGGEALGCLYSIADPKGCGFSLNCKACGVRNTVLDTFKTGKPHYQAEAALPFKIDEKKTVLNLLVNTVPIEHEGKRMVLVSIDNITELKTAQNKLKERVKELKCLYILSNLSTLPDTTMEKLFKKTIELMPPSWQYPEITCARIVFNGRVYKSRNFKATRWKQYADIKVSGKKLGTLEIYYLEKRPDMYEGPFLKEEKELIISVSEIISKFIERKKTEKELEDSENRFKRLSESSEEGIVFHDKGKVIDANKAAAKMHGVTLSDLIGMNVLNLLTPVSKKIAEEKINIRNTQLYEIQFQNPNGKILDVEVIGKPTYLNGRKVRVAVIRDITKRKKAEIELKKSYHKTEKALSGTIKTLATIVETRDPYTSGHQKRVAKLAKAISLELGMDEDKIKTIHTAALIHDIGKINVPASILAKPGKISDLEYNMIKTHSTEGYKILKKIEFQWPLAKIVLQHHEKLDGTGYPEGLKCKDIVLEAKIIAVADVIEAMSSHRPYRPALGMEEALKEVKMT